MRSTSPLAMPRHLTAQASAVRRPLKAGPTWFSGLGHRYANIFCGLVVMVATVACACQSGQNLSAVSVKAAKSFPNTTQRPPD